MIHGCTTLSVYPSNPLYLKQRTVARYHDFSNGHSSFCSLLLSLNSSVYNISSFGVCFFFWLTYEAREHNTIWHMLLFILVLHISIFTPNNISVSCYSGCHTCFLFDFCVCLLLCSYPWLQVFTNYYLSHIFNQTICSESL